MKLISLGVVNVLVAPDKFKGSLSAVAAVEAITRGWQAVFPDAKLRALPIADGGEGFAELLRSALNGEWIVTRAKDPLGREVDARYAWIEHQKMAVIEMSEASGMWRLTSAERDPLRATTFGTGQLIRHAAMRCAKTILVGLGGSATTDGGVGMAAALGYKTLTSDGEDLEPIPCNLTALTRFAMDEVIELPEIIAACDVRNPLLGPKGTARVFSPQKGATPEMVETLELCMEALADVVTQDLECDFREAPGAGAAGGIGFGLMSFCGAKMRSGFEVIAEALRLKEKVSECDLVITGEGRIDSQTLEGKGPAGLAAIARDCGKPVLAFAGSIEESAEIRALFPALCPIIDQPIALDEAMERGTEFLERAATRTARIFQLAKVL